MKIILGTKCDGCHWFDGTSYYTFIIYYRKKCPLCGKLLINELDILLGFCVLVLCVIGALVEWLFKRWLSKEKKRMTIKKTANKGYRVIDRDEKDKKDI